MAQTPGTSNLQFTLLDREVHDPGLYGAFPDITIPGYYGLEGGQTSSGGVIKWFLENGFADSCKEQAREEGCSVLDLLNRMAEQIPAGLHCEGIPGRFTPGRFTLRRNSRPVYTRISYFSRFRKAAFP